MDIQKKSWVSRIPSILILFVLLVFAVAPLLWMISTSFKTTQEASAIPPTFIPHSPTLEPYIEGWKTKNFTVHFYNTAVVSVITTALCVFLSSMAGYGFSRFKIKGASLILTLLFVMQMFPTSVVLIPYYMLMKFFGLINTYASLVFAYTSFSLPLCIWMMKSFFDTIPKELDESARIDGCNPLQTFIRITLPLTRPGLISTVIFTFLNAWKEYLFALTLCNKKEMWVISVALTSFIGEHFTSWNMLMAVSLLSLLPIVIIFLFLQEYMVGGLVSGAVKG